MKKKYIQTGDIKKWKRFEAIGSLLPVVIFALLCIRLIPLWRQAGPEKGAGQYGVFVLIFLTVIFSIPTVLLWRALFRQIKRNAIQRATFRAVQDIDYYRDKLEGLSPVEISILTDLKIEPEKDVSALLLNYQMNGILTFDGKTVQILRPDDPSLLPSDKLLIQAIMQYGVSERLLEHLSEWKITAFSEVAQGKYFRSNSAKKNAGCLPGCLNAAVVPLIIAGIFVLILNSTPLKYTMNLIHTMPDNTSNITLMQKIFTDHTLALGVILMLVFFLLLVLAFVWPVAAIVRFTAKASGVVRIRRTEEGEQLTEYIYAMKNFLHDFSALSEANKEHLVLWEYFLVYAVVLEENEQILRDIFSRKSLELGDIILKRRK